MPGLISAVFGLVSLGMGVAGLVQASQSQKLAQSQFEESMNFSRAMSQESIALSKQQYEQSQRDAAASIEASYAYGSNTKSKMHRYGSSGKRI